MRISDWSSDVCSSDLAFLVALGWVDDAHAHRRGARGADAELFGRALAQIDDAAAREGAAIVDADEDRAPGLERGALDIAGQRQRLVRGGDPIGAELLAVDRKSTRLYSSPSCASSLPSSACKQK